MIKIERANGKPVKPSNSVSFKFIVPAMIAGVTLAGLLPDYDDKVKASEVPKTINTPTNIMMSVVSNPAPSPTSNLSNLVSPIGTTSKPVVVLVNRGSEARGYDYTKLTCPQWVFDALKEVGDKEGLPETVWYPIAKYESSFNPKCRTLTAKEDSRGIFQVNTFSHPNADKNKLYDVTYNATYQMPELVRYYNKGKSLGLSGVDLTCYVSRYGQRPDWASEKTRNYIISTISKGYKEIMNAKKQ